MRAPMRRSPALAAVALAAGLLALSAGEASAQSQQAGEPGAAPCPACLAEASGREERIARALAAPDRPLDHRLRDERREVARIIAAAWPQRRPLAGGRVLDIGSGGGYLALIYASLVGEDGHVDIHNTPGWIAQFPGLDPARQAAWIRRANIGWLTAGWDEIGASKDRYDVILLGQVFHDMLLEGGDVEAISLSLLTLLNPGGVVMVEDHNAAAGMPLAQQAGLHRISSQTLTALFLGAGFRPLAAFEIESPHDNRRMNVFWPSLRGRTDRFIAVFEKPAEP
jgi:predicted methyltransferase